MARKKKQQYWIDYSQTAHKKGNFYTPSAPLLFSLQQALYDHHKDKEHKKQIESIRAFLQQKYQGNWLWTLSQVEYKQKEKDIITHDVGLPSQYTLTADIKGERGKVTNLSSLNIALENIFGICDVKQAEQLGQWLTKKSVYLWRYISSEITTTELCGVTVSGNYDVFNLYGISHVGSLRASFGVRLL